jgi:type VI secretion system protein ImpH
VIPPPPAARLAAEPRRFRFDAAVRVLLWLKRRADPAEAVRFGTPPGLAYPAAEVVAVHADDASEPARAAVGMMGLTGAAGVLPRLYSESVVATVRARERALVGFLDLLSDRMVAMFARAGIKYRLHRAAETAAQAEPPGPDQSGDALLALTGYGTAHLVPRLAAGAEPLLHYAGLMAMRPRSAERLAALVSDWLGREVEVVQFAGAWLALPSAERTAMPRGHRSGQYNRMGVDAAIGVRAWDVQARVVLRIGPLDRAAFAALLPDRPALHRLVSLVRAYLGFETGFAVNPVLAGPEVPALRLATAGPAPRLGWNTWIPAPGPAPFGIRRPDAADAVFEAEAVEAEQARIARHPA